MNIHPAHLMFILTGIVLVTLSITYCATMIRMDTRMNKRRLQIMTMLVFILGIFTYILSLFYFSADPTYLFQFLLAVAALVILPAALTSVAVATITAGNN